MKETKQPITESSNSWQLPELFELSELQANWLAHSGSLTQRLRLLTHHQIQHVICSRGWQQPLDEELKLFAADIHKQPFWIREIEWRFQQQPWVLGRVIMPKQTVDAHQYHQQQQYQRSIGELLFTDESTQRLSLTLQSLPSNHPYFQRASTYLETNTNIKSLWARRSLFLFQQQPLIVSETFLPQFWRHCKH